MSGPGACTTGCLDHRNARTTLWIALAASAIPRQRRIAATGPARGLRYVEDMKTALLALAASLTPLSALAIDRPGPVTLDTEITVCRDPYDHVRSTEFVKTDPMAWLRFRKETLGDGRCYDIPAGRRVFAMERVYQPAPMECIRVEGETSCAWSFPFVAIQLRKAAPSR